MPTADLLRYALIIPAKLVVLLAALTLALGLRLPTRCCWAIAIFGWLAAIALTGTRFPDATDITHFWNAGQALRQGDDPYSVPFLNLPTILPFFWLLSALPWEAAVMTWAWLNLTLTAVLPFACQRALTDPADTDSTLTTSVIAVFSAALCLSPANYYGVDIGQLFSIVALPLVLAVWAARQQRPWLAGVGLALGSIKVSTMLPFLLLFQRRRDLRVWLAMVFAGLGLCLIAGPIDELPGWLTGCWTNIGKQSEPGRINDYVHPFNFDLIALERGYFYLGLSDRTTIRILALLTVAALGAWVAWQVRRLGWPAAASLVACYAALFLYHRVYDMCILVLPLVYAAGQVRSTRGWPRCLYSATALAILGVWFIQVDLILKLAYQSPTTLAGAFIQALIVPYPIWLTLVSLLSLAAAEACRPASTEPVQFHRLDLVTEPDLPRTNLDPALHVSPARAAELASPKDAT